MASLSADEQRQIGAGTQAFLDAFRMAPPAGAAADPAFLQAYTDRLGTLATTQFSASLQALLEEEPEFDAGMLQSDGGGGSIGQFVLRAFQKRLCNPVAEAELKAELDRVRQEHKLGINPTAAGITSSAATAIAIAVGSLLGSGPLAIVLAPLAGSVALLLLLVGVDGFCAWAASRTA